MHIGRYKLVGDNVTFRAAVDAKINNTILVGESNYAKVTETSGWGYCTPDCDSNKKGDLI